MHPAIMPAIERAAYLGGCDGEAGALGAEKFGIPATGTLPHALALILGSTAEAAKAFDETIDPEANHTILIDTFEHEKFGALIAARAIPDSIFAARLDIPGDRRGDFASLIREVRWELDRAGFSITLLKLDDEMKGYLRAPCDVVAGRPFWRGGSYGGGQRK
jgi:nicotinate phosphoribosyltransferase